MITLYAYTYPATRSKIPGYILTKVGDTRRDVQTRLKEQGGAAEAESKVLIGEWPGLTKIARDYEIHRELEAEGLKYHGGGSGTEWFKIPGNTDEEAFAYIDAIVTKLEQRVVRNGVTLRKLQKDKMNETLDIIERAAMKGQDMATVIANLCPRFGKTIWALSLFGAITQRWGNRVMLLPAYWLSSQTSFKNEIKQFAEFQDITVIDGSAADAADMFDTTFNDTTDRMVITFSLHGDFKAWAEKYRWMKDIPLDHIFSFIDEGDFGTHTPNQKEKLNLVFDRS